MGDWLSLGCSLSSRLYLYSGVILLTGFIMFTLSFLPKRICSLHQIESDDGYIQSVTPSGGP